MSKKKKYAVIDLFCGVGGLSHGFVLEKGFEIVAGIDSDQSCEFAFSSNNGAKFLCEDLSQFNPAEIDALFPNDAIKILVGCAPCQPFSRYTSGIKPHNIDDKWSLLRTCWEIRFGFWA